MKRTAVVVMGIALALTGCGSGDDQAIKDALYLQMAKEAAPGVKDSTLLEVRSQTCAAFKAAPKASTYVAVISAATKNGVDAATAGKLTGLAVASACPEYASLIS